MTVKKATSKENNIVWCCRDRYPMARGGLGGLEQLSIFTCKKRPEFIPFDFPSSKSGKFYVPYDDGDRVYLCVKAFKKVFGFCPKPGECFRIKLTGEILK